MANINSKKLREALAKAKKVGRAEEPVVIDGCSLVLQSLEPSAYEAIHEETREVDEQAYIYAFQIGHICRSIVELEGVDLRDVEFVEDEVPQGAYLVNAALSKTKAAEAKELLKSHGIDLTVVPPDGAEGTRQVTIEKAEWLRKIVSTWSREAINISFRKFADVVVEGEKRAKESVEFKVKDEKDEDKYRRLLIEAKELESELPTELVQKILSDSGYLQKSTPEELAEVARRAKEFEEEQEVKKQEEAADNDDGPSSDPPPSKGLAEAQALMKNRVPLNQAPSEAPPPPVQRQAPVPQQLLDAASSSNTRTSQIAALETEFDGVPLPPVANSEVPVVELSKPAPKLDGPGIKSIIDRPPTAGINPRFRRHT